VCNCQPIFIIIFAHIHYRKLATAEGISSYYNFIVLSWGIINIDYTLHFTIFSCCFRHFGIFMAARQLADRRPLYFTGVCFYRLFSSPNLGGLWADRHQTLPHVRWWLQFIKSSQKFGGFLHPKKNWRPKNIKILARFQTSWLDREYLQTGTRHRRSENGVGNCNHSSACYQIWWTMVYKRRKIGPAFRPTQWTFGRSDLRG